MKKMRVKSQTMINIRISRKLRSGFEIKVRFFGRSVHVQFLTDLIPSVCINKKL